MSQIVQDLVQHAADRVGNIVKDKLDLLDDAADGYAFMLTLTASMFVSFTHALASHPEVGKLDEATQRQLALTLLLRSLDLKTPSIQQISDVCVAQHYFPCVEVDHRS